MLLTCGQCSTPDAPVPLIRAVRPFGALCCVRCGTVQHFGEHVPDPARHRADSPWAWILAVIFILLALFAAIWIVGAIFGGPM